MHGDDEADGESALLLEAAFITGFRAAADKQAFLQLAGIATELSIDGALGLKLIAVRIAEAFTVGATSPGFGSRDLVYHPLPGPMVRQTGRLVFEYVSLTERRELTLAETRAASHQHAPRRG